MSKKKVLVLGFLFAMGMQSSIFCSVATLSDEQQQKKARETFKPDGTYGYNAKQISSLRDLGITKENITKVVSDHIDRSGNFNDSAWRKNEFKEILLIGLEENVKVAKARANEAAAKVVKAEREAKKREAKKTKEAKKAKTGEADNQSNEAASSSDTSNITSDSEQNDFTSANNDASNDAVEQAKIVAQKAAEKAAEAKATLQQQKDAKAAEKAAAKAAEKAKVAEKAKAASDFKKWQLEQERKAAEGRVSNSGTKGTDRAAGER